MCFTINAFNIKQAVFMIELIHSVMLHVYKQLIEILYDQSAHMSHSIIDPWPIGLLHVYDYLCTSPQNNIQL